MAMHNPSILWRGVEEYSACYDAMRRYTDSRTPDSPDQLWIVEHPPVYTLGLGADPGHVLDPHGIPVVQTDRGGEVTYHGPGQAVVYLLMDLRRGRSRLFARDFVFRIEQAVIATLAAYNLTGQRKAGAPGIYLPGPGTWEGAKIAALGLKVRGNGCTYHGVSLNVSMDLAPFSWINPCGYPGLPAVDMRSLGVTPPLEAVQAALADQLVNLLDSR